MNCEIPDIQAGFRKGRGTRDQIANIHWIIKKAKEFHKNIYFCFIDYTKGFGKVNQAEIDVFLELFCFFHDPADVGNLISGSSAFSKSFCLFTIVWSQVNSREETQPSPSTENWIKDLLSMALPIRTRPIFWLSQSLPSGSFYKPLILLHHGADRLKTMGPKMGPIKDRNGT